MATYAISDLHLHDDDQPYLFTPGKERILTRILGEIDASGSGLVLAGDILDLTGMNPPAQGLPEFFNQVLPASVADSPAMRALGVKRPTTELVRAVRRRFPHFFDALQPLAKAGRLTLIPGNHDCAIASAEGRQAWAEALGVSEGAVKLQQSVQRGDFVIAQHGHEYDGSNRTDNGCANRGSVITAALYRGVMPALQMLGVHDQVAYAVPAVRPEENIVNGIAGYLDQGSVSSLLLGLVRLLFANQYFPSGLPKFEAWVASSFGAGVTPQRVREALAADGEVAAQLEVGAQRLLDVTKLTPKLAVLGHSHVFAGKANYVNLGTWIDHVTGLDQASLNDADTSLPILCLDGSGGGQVYDASDLLSRDKLAACAVLWQAA